MENIVIDNATYLVGRVFIGNKNVSALIQSRIENENSHVLPFNNKGFKIMCCVKHIANVVIKEK